MNQENNNQIIPSFYFSIKEYLHIFDINSLLALNNFINTRLNSNMSPTTAYRIFIYGMYEFQKSVISSPEVANNIILKILQFLKVSSSETKINSIYKLILNAKNIDDFKNIQLTIEK